MEGSANRFCRRYARWVAPVIVTRIPKSFPEKKKGKSSCALEHEKKLAIDMMPGEILSSLLIFSVAAIGDASKALPCMTGKAQVVPMAILGRGDP